MLAKKCVLVFFGLPWESTSGHVLSFNILVDHGQNNDIYRFLQPEVELTN